MARRISYASRARATARRHHGAEPWLLLLGFAALFAMLFGWFSPRPPARENVGGAKLTMAEARASNAAVPISGAWRGTAAPFRLVGGPAAREQATECLATAALYEAGDDRRGQRAVIQVILNRVRAPGFAKTVCGVVYQGHERLTGCQFSFTCDGSFERRPIHLGWIRARRAARRALNGYVDKPIGVATHYHADWIVPFWRDSLTKVARVGSHLFYVRDRPVEEPDRLVSRGR